MNQGVKQILDSKGTIDVPVALQSLAPGAQWICSDGSIQWLDKSQKQPTQTQINAEIKRLIKLQKQRQYRRLRKEEHIPLDEQLDMLYWDKKNGTNNWEVYVDEIKAKHPKS